MTTTTTLAELYRAAAEVAYKRGIRADNEAGLRAWVRQNCVYRADTEFFLFLGIGCALADLEAQAQGYKNEVDRALSVAQAVVEGRRGVVINRTV